MKVTKDGKRYDSDKMETIAERSLYSHSNNYAGSRCLKRASDGTYWSVTESNGQDCHITDDIYPIENPVAFIEYLAMDDDQETRAVELGLITIID